MTEPFSTQANTDDLHLLMAVAVLSGQRGVDQDLAPIYDAWEKCYPDDALGGIGRGLAMIGRGEAAEGYLLIERMATSARTRRDQAREVLNSLRRDISALAE